MAIKRKREQRLPDSFTMQPAASDASNESAVAPCAVYFANGFDPTAGPPLSWSLQQNPAGRRLVVARAEKVDFVGSEGASSGPPACRYAVGVMDRKKRILTYAPIQGNALIRMEVKLHTEAAKAEQKIDSVLHASPAEKREAHNRLVHMFGSQRAKRDLAAKQASYVSPEALGNTDAVKGLLQAAGDKAVAAGGTRNEVMALAAAARNIPAHHPEATLASDAYRLEELLPEGVQLDLHRLDKASNNEQYRTEVCIDKGTVPKVVLDRLKQLPGEPGEARTRLLQCLAMLTALLNLLALSSHLTAFVKPGQVSSIQHLSRLANVEADLMRYLLDKYYEFRHGEDRKDHFTISAANKALLTLHALVYALIIDGFVIGPGEFEGLRSQLKLQPPQLATYFRELGCYTKSVGKKSSVATTQQQFRVVLLPHTNPSKTLAEVLPSLQKGARMQRGR